MPMSATIISGCLTGLGMPPGSGVPGLLTATSVLPAASQRLLDAIEQVVAGAEQLVDIAGLKPFATGGFAAASPGPPPVGLR